MVKLVHTPYGVKLWIGQQKHVIEYPTCMTAPIVILSNLTTQTQASRRQCEARDGAKAPISEVRPWPHEPSARNLRETINNEARTLKERNNLNSRDEDHIHANNVFKPKHNEGNAEGEVFSMDYTPASRKPPIHN
ncbi:uncharacterized protein G2W53_009059 [Senna tora]|uniref:Uncharacterized protein n=1 Tax=Senna tora TaxID=362788 RepID=A0A834WWR3_9FABA|nr:uncharacterized protein G2W53_009059 [Senna tora]